ncbi:MAG: glycosyltransferase family 9 protein [Acidobacteriota bacterium]
MSQHDPANSLLPSLPAGSRLLIIRLRSIGDIVLLTPALRLLKQWRPDLRTSVLVDSRFRDLLDANPDIEEVIGLEKAAGYRRLAAEWQTIRKLRRKRFSVCLNLHGGPTSTTLMAASGAQWKAGFWHFRLQRLYNILVPDARKILNQSSIHTAEHQACALFWLGLPQTEIPAARLEVCEEDSRWWSTQRDAAGIPAGQPYAVVHPTALYPTKQWAPEHFAKAGSFLEREAGLKVIYSAGPGESSVLDAVERACGQHIRRLGNASLGKFAAAMAEARLFLGNDSGPAHMAAALGRPSVVVFGSSSSSIWGPWPPADPARPSHVVQNSYECNPCPGDRCYRYDRPECILSITYEQVRDALQAVLRDSLEHFGSRC